MELLSFPVAILALASLLLALQAQVCDSTQGCPSIKSYNVIAEYPKDAKGFTQGLQFDRLCNDTTQQCFDVFWESTGLYGQSSMRLVDVASGEVRLKTDVDRQYFGEGSVKLGNTIYQLTWKSGLGFKYHPSNLTQIGTFNTGLRDGWGMTSDGTHLIVTDSSAEVYFLDPSSMRIVKQITAQDAGHPLRWLNELEFIEGELWANVWQTECIARINVTTGHVTSWIVMNGLRNAVVNRFNSLDIDVLNGIAYDFMTKRLFITGKLWPRIFEVKIVPHPDTSLTIEKVRKQCWPHVFPV